MSVREFCVLMLVCLIWGFGVVGSLVLWPLSLILEDRQMSAFAPETRVNFGMALIYSTLLVSLVAHGSYYWLLQRLPIHTVAPSGLMTTVIGVAAGIVILKEAPTPILFMGAMITLSGISIILWRNKRQSEAKQKTKVTEIS